MVINKVERLETTVLHTYELPTLERAHLTRVTMRGYGAGIIALISASKDQPVDEFFVANGVAVELVRPNLEYEAFGEGLQYDVFYRGVMWDKHPRLRGMIGQSMERRERRHIEAAHHHAKHVLGGLLTFAAEDL